MDNIRTFYHYLESRKNENSLAGKLATRIIAESEFGNACCFHGKDVSVVTMTRYLNSRNSPSHLIIALRETFNDWKKFLEDRRQIAHQAYKPKIHNFKNEK